MNSRLDQKRKAKEEKPFVKNKKKKSNSKGLTWFNDQDFQVLLGQISRDASACDRIKAFIKACSKNECFVKDENSTYKMCLTLKSGNHVYLEIQELNQGSYKISVKQEHKPKFLEITFPDLKAVIYKNKSLADEFLKELKTKFPEITLSSPEQKKKPTETKKLKPKINESKQSVNSGKLPDEILKLTKGSQNTKDILSIFSESKAFNGARTCLVNWKQNNITVPIQLKLLPTNWKPNDPSSYNPKNAASWVMTENEFKKLNNNSTSTKYYRLIATDETVEKGYSYKTPIIEMLLIESNNRFVLGELFHLQRSVLLTGNILLFNFFGEFLNKLLQVGALYLQDHSNITVTSPERPWATLMITPSKPKKFKPNTYALYKVEETWQLIFVDKNSISHTLHINEIAGLKNALTKDKFTEAEKQQLLKLITHPVIVPLRLTRTLSNKRKSWYEEAGFFFDTFTNRVSDSNEKVSWAQSADLRNVSANFLRTMTLSQLNIQLTENEKPILEKLFARYKFSKMETTSVEDLITAVFDPSRTGSKESYQDIRDLESLLKWQQDLEEIDRLDNLETPTFVYQAGEVSKKAEFDKLMPYRQYVKLLMFTRQGVLKQQNAAHHNETQKAVSKP